MELHAKVRYIIFFTVDNLIAGLIVTPLVVAFWRGMWDLLDHHFIPEHPTSSAWISIAFGLIGMTVLSLLQDSFKRLRIAHYSLAWFLIFHVYSYVGAILQICHWRGLWLILDMYTGQTYVSFVCCLVLGQLALWLLRASKCLAAPPQCLFLDVAPEFFTWVPRFGIEPKRVVAHALDQIFTIWLIYSAVILQWRGVWGLADLYFHPEDQVESAKLSMIIGYCIFILAMPLQIACNVLYKELLRLGSSRLTRIILEDFVYLVGNFGTVHVWRGLRMGIGFTVLPSNPLGSCLLCHILGFTLLSLMLSADSVQARGFTITGGRSKDSCLFQNQFIRYFFSAPNDAQYSRVSTRDAADSADLSRKIVKYRNVIVKLSAGEDREVLVGESSEV